MGTKLYLLLVAELALMNVFVFGVKAQETTNITPGNSSVYEHSCDLEQSPLCIPTCCAPNEILKRSKENGYNCQKAPKINNIYQYLVFDSNATHINTTSDTQTLPVFQRNLTCNESRVLKETSYEFGLGFIFNSSVILVDLSKREISLVPPTNYCIDYRDNNYTWFQVCGARPKPVPSLEYYFYFSFLIASTICYFISAAFYILVLKVNDIHKRCFVGYTVSMGLAFLFLIFLQSYHTNCNNLGFFFYTFMVCGFLWLTFLCLDLAVEVKYYMEAQATERWLWYLGASIVFPLMMVFISVIPDGLVDVPKAFTKEFYYGHVYCRFNKSRLEFFFIPVGLLMLASLVCLCATIYYIRVNNRDYRNNFSWLDKRSSYKYMFRSCLLSWILTLVWLIEILISEKILEKYGMSLPRTLSLIEAVQGICALLLFVSNRYTRKEILKILCPKSNNESNNMEILLQQLDQKENKNNCNTTSEEASKLTEASSSGKPET